LQLSTAQKFSWQLFGKVTKITKEKDSDVYNLIPESPLCLQGELLMAFVLTECCSFHHKGGSA